MHFNRAECLAVASETNGGGQQHEYDRFIAIDTNLFSLVSKRCFLPLALLSTTPIDFHQKWERNSEIVPRRAKFPRHEPSSGKCSKAAGFEFDSVTQYPCLSSSTELNYSLSACQIAVSHTGIKVAIQIEILMAFS